VKMKDSLLILGLMMATISATTYGITSVSNTTINIAFGDCYNISLSEGWQMFCPPPYPKLNVFTTLDYGANYTDSTANITVKSLPFPTIQTNLSSGQTYENSSIKIFCAQVSLTKYNVNKTLVFDDTYKNDDGNISITCETFPRVNVARELLPGEQYAPADARFNLSVTCKWINLAEYMSYNASYQTLKSECDTIKTERDSVKSERDTAKSDLNSTTFKLSNVTAEWNLCKTTPVITTVIPTMNKTCNMTTVVINNVNISYCPEDVTSLCTPEEKLSGKLSDCINRLAADAVKKQESLTGDLTACSTAKNRCESGEAMNQENQDKWTMIIIGLVAAIGGGWLLTEYLKHKRAAEE